MRTHIHEHKVELFGPARNECVKFTKCGALECSTVYFYILANCASRSQLKITQSHLPILLFIASRSLADTGCGGSEEM